MSAKFPSLALIFLAGLVCLAQALPTASKKPDDVMSDMDKALFMLQYGKRAGPNCLFSPAGCMYRFQKKSEAEQVPESKRAAPNCLFSPAGCMYRFSRK